MAKIIKFALAMALGAVALGQAAAAPDYSRSDSRRPMGGGLVIEPAELPEDVSAGAVCGEAFMRTGDYVPVLHWRVESGALPPGITLEDNGELRGAAEAGGGISVCGGGEGWRTTAAGGAEGIHDQGGGGDHGGVEGIRRT